MQNIVVSIPVQNGVLSSISEFPEMNESQEQRGESSLQTYSSSFQRGVRSRISSRNVHDIHVVNVCKESIDMGFLEDDVQEETEEILSDDEEDKRPVLFRNALALMTINIVFTFAICYALRGRNPIRLRKNRSRKHVSSDIFFVIMSVILSDCAHFFTVMVVQGLFKPSFVVFAVLHTEYVVLTSLLLDNLMKMFNEGWRMIIFTSFIGVAVTLLVMTIYQAFLQRIMTRMEVFICSLFMSIFVSTVLMRELNWYNRHITRYFSQIISVARYVLNFHPVMHLFFCFTLRGTAQER